MKLLKERLARWSMIGLMAGVAATSFYVPTASAHGEKSQAAFMRMRTIHWYDLKWSKEKVNVNDTVEISGKLHVFEGWPETVAEPHTAFLNIGIPGPVSSVRNLTLVASWFPVQYALKSARPMNSAWY